MEAIGIIMTAYNVGCGIYMIYKNSGIIKEYYEEKEKYKIIQNKQSINVQDELDDFELIK